MTDLTKADLRERLGNIDQIRDILFGPQIREFLSRLEQLERNLATQGQEFRSRLEEVRQGVAADVRGDLEALDKKIRLLTVKDREEKDDIRQHIDSLSKRIVTVADELEESLGEEIDQAVETLEQRLKVLSTKDEEEKFELRQQIDSVNKKLTHQVEALDEALDSQTTNLREDFLASRDKLQGDLDDLRSQIFEELERYVSLLTEVKISKDDMAELLFELGLRLKGTEFVPELQEMGNGSESSPLEPKIMAPELPPEPEADRPVADFPGESSRSPRKSTRMGSRSRKP
jgi:uncharacterized phage infection (PIP) family protein YhgE